MTEYYLFMLKKKISKLFFCAIQHDFQSNVFHVFHAFSTFCVLSLEGRTQQCPKQQATDVSILMSQPKKNQLTGHALNANLLYFDKLLI